MCPRCTVARQIDNMRRQFLSRAFALRELHEYFGAASVLHDPPAETDLRTGYTLFAINVYPDIRGLQSTHTLNSVNSIVPRLPRALHLDSGSVGACVVCNPHIPRRPLSISNFGLSGHIYVVCNQHAPRRPLSIPIVIPSGYTLFAINIYPDAPSLDFKTRSVKIYFVYNRRTPRRSLSISISGHLWPPWT